MPSSRKCGQPKTSQIQIGLLAKNNYLQLQGVEKCLNSENKNYWNKGDGELPSEPCSLLADLGSLTVNETKLSSRVPVKASSSFSGLPAPKGFTRRQIADDSGSRGPATLQEPSLSSFGKKMNMSEMKGVTRSDIRSHNRVLDLQSNSSTGAVDNFRMALDENKNSEQSDFDARDRTVSSKGDDSLIAAMNNGGKKESSLIGVKNITPKYDVATATSPARSLKSSKLATPTSSARARSVTDSRAGRPAQVETVRSSSLSAKVSSGNSSRPASEKEFGSFPAKMLEQTSMPASPRRGNNAYTNNGSEVSSSISSEQLAAKMSSKSCALRPPKVIHVASHAHDGSCEAIQNDLENGNRNQLNNLLAYRPPSYKIPYGKETSETLASEKCQSGSARGMNSSPYQKVIHRQLPDPPQGRKGTSKLNSGDECQSEAASVHSVAPDCISSHFIPSAISSSGRSKLRQTNLGVKTAVSPPPVPMRCQSLSSESCSVRSVSSIHGVKISKQQQLESSQDASKNKKLPKKEGTYENATFAESLEMKCAAQANLQPVPMKYSACGMAQESLRPLISGQCIDSNNVSLPSSRHFGFSVSALSPRHGSSCIDKHYSHHAAPDHPECDRKHSFTLDAKNCGYLSDTTGLEVGTGFALRRDNSINDGMNDAFAIPNSSRNLYRSFHGSAKNAREDRR